MDEPTKCFTGLAEIYATARPGYPEEAISYIIEQAQLSQDSKIADIGAGTGISSRLFAQLGFHVTAIEPNDDMRLKAVEEGTVFGGGTIEYVSGTGESTGLLSGSQDLALAAQAFHWFKPDEALKEFHRILKPEGCVALIWNERDESDPLTAAYGEALRLGPDTDRVESQRFKAGQPLLDSELFKNAHRKPFKNTQNLDLTGFLNRAFSASYTPKVGELADLIKSRLTSSFEKHETNGRVSLHYITSIFIAWK